MTRLIKHAVYGYMGFAVVNAGLAYATSTARTGRQPGQSKLLDLNDRLLSLNLLARFTGIQPAYLTAPMVTLPDTVVTAPALPSGL